MTNYDKLLIVVVAIFSLAGIYIGKSQIDSSESKYVYIEVNGEKYREIVFDENTNMSTVIDTDYGYNEVLIKDGKVIMREADCRDQICVKESGISRVGEINVCLPNRVSVEIRGLESENEIDYISH
jgi:hypothetical protein